MRFPGFQDSPDDEPDERSGRLLWEHWAILLILVAAYAWAALALF